MAGGAGCFVAQPALDEPLLVDLSDPSPVGDAGGRTADVAWQCSRLN